MLQCFFCANMANKYCYVTGGIFYLFENGRSCNVTGGRFYSEKILSGPVNNRLARVRFRCVRSVQVAPTARLHSLQANAMSGRSPARYASVVDTLWYAFGPSGSSFSCGVLGWAPPGLVCGRAAWTPSYSLPSRPSARLRCPPHQRPDPPFARREQRPRPPLEEQSRTR